MKKLFLEMLVCLLVCAPAVGCAEQNKADDETTKDVTTDVPATKVVCVDGTVKLK